MCKSAEDEPGDHLVGVEKCYLRRICL